MGLGFGSYMWAKLLEWTALVTTATNKTSTIDGLSLYLNFAQITVALSCGLLIACLIGIYGMFKVKAF